MPAVTEGGQLDAIERLHELFGRHEIDYWLFGGWAVDFHARNITRAHEDIDIAVWKADLGRVDMVLSRDGWKRSTRFGENGYTEYVHGSIRLDLAFLARDVKGVVYTPLAEGRGRWPNGAFGDDVTELEGVSAHVVTLSSLIEDKSEPHGDDPSSAMKDQADVAVLIQLQPDE
jgi:hypothetical protein